MSVKQVDERGRKEYFESKSEKYGCKVAINTTSVTVDAITINSDNIYPSSIPKPNNDNTSG